MARCLRFASFQLMVIIKKAADKTKNVPPMAKPTRLRGACFGELFLLDDDDT